jgi:hypothetical protein
MKGLDQDSFNSNKNSKRSAQESYEYWNMDWTHSSSLQTLNSFKIDSGSIVKQNENLLKFATTLKTTKQVCSDMFMSDSALVACNMSNIININELIGLCELDYDVAPVRNCLLFLKSTKCEHSLSK